LDKPLNPDFLLSVFLKSFSFRVKCIFYPKILFDRRKGSGVVNVPMKDYPVRKPIKWQ
jgi:hypothetical protein